MQETWTIPTVTTPASIEVSQRERVAGLFDRHQERLYRLARRLACDPDEARDIVQDTFLRVARRPGSVPMGARPEEAWLVRIVVNLVRDRNRRAVVRERARSARTSSGETGFHQIESAAVARLTVREALLSLPPRRRAIVVLHEMEGVPVSRIAETLGTARVTVRWHLSQARRELARRLAPHATPAMNDRRGEGSDR